jgi:hypothetical protein
MKKHDNNDHIPARALIIAGADFGMKEGCKQQAINQGCNNETDICEGGGHRSYQVKN